MNQDQPPIALDTVDRSLASGYEPIKAREMNEACRAFFHSRGMLISNQYLQSQRLSKHRRKRVPETPHHIEN